MRKLVRRCSNLFVIGLLRSPLHRLADGSLLLLTYRGRQSGRRFTIPVMYAEQDGTLTSSVTRSGRDGGGTCAEAQKSRYGSAVAA
jgi:hypothetical protein